MRCQYSEFCGDDSLAATPLQEFSKQRLRFTISIRTRYIEKPDALVPCGSQSSQ
jgi:hypothetical protein